MTHLQLIVDIMRNKPATVGKTDDQIADDILMTLGNQGFDIGIEYAER